MNNDFSNVKVGDRLWSPTFRWGVVDIAEPSKSTTLYVRTSYNKYKEFDMRGIPLGYPTYPQSLFFEEMQLVPVSKPAEAKTFDPNKPYQRRDGNWVKILYQRKDGRFIVIDDSEIPFQVGENGIYYTTGEESVYDLINIPEKIQTTVEFFESNKIPCPDTTGWGEEDGFTKEK